MQKADIVNKVAKKAGLEKETANRAVDAFIESIKEAYADHQEVSIRKFGTFFVQQRAPKKARNISTGDQLLVSEHMKPVFKPSNNLKDMTDKRWRKKEKI